MNGQGRLDAMADAETLFAFLFDRGAAIDVDRREMRLALLEAQSKGGYAASEAPWWVSASYNAHDAARAAFRAVPGLR